MLCQVMTLDLMTFIIEKIVPLMDIADNVIYRQGATEALACILSIFRKKDHMTGLIYIIHIKYHKFMKELTFFYVQCLLTFMSTILIAKKNSQFEIMKFDNSNIFFKYFHLMYIL